MNPSNTLIKDLTQGNIRKQLVHFVLPLMMANALQTAFNLVDMFFVGRYAGTQALSAVSIGGQITMLMFSLYLGLATGAQICVAQAVGSGNRGQLNGLVGNSITISVLVGLVTMIVIPLAGPILTIMQTPAEIMGKTVLYLRICCYANILIALYNSISGTMRGMGDSRHPMVFIVVATVVNIVLDYLFIAVFKWGVAGAAWATIIGQSSAAVVAIVFLYKKRKEFGFDFKMKSFRLEGRYSKPLFQIGVPVSAKALFINLSFLFVNANINHFGVVSIAAAGIAQKVLSVMNIVSNALNDGTASIVGQNFAAGKQERVQKTVWTAAGIGLAFSFILIALFLLFPHQIFGIFTRDQEVIAVSRPYLACCAIMAFTFALMSPTIGLINGVGNAALNMVIAFADGVAARIILSLIFGYGLEMGAVGFYLGNCLAGFVSVIWGGWYFLSGRWKKRKVLGN